MRKKKNARRRIYAPMTFKQMCNSLGLSPKDRIKLIRSLKDSNSRKAESG